MKKLTLLFTTFLTILMLSGNEIHLDDCDITRFGSEHTYTCGGVENYGHRNNGN